MITMRDIAVRAGVSRSTVSLVLNDKHEAVGLNEDTRRRVLRVADELGYRRNELARSVVTGKSPLFGFMIYAPMLHSDVAARVLNGILDEADKQNYSVQVLRISTGNSESVIKRCVELRPAGVMGLYVGAEILEQLQQEMSRFHIPVAVLDSTPPVAGSSRILSNDIEGCRQAIGHLTELGHQRIAFIGGNPESIAGKLRAQGYQTAMAEHGLPIPPDYQQVGFWESEIVEQCVRRLFDRSDSPTAIFCADDKTAMVACRALRERGLHVPGDVSLIGFADLTMAFYSDPPLTTVSQPFQEMGRRAVRRLFAVSQEWQTTTSASYYEELLPTRLIIRRSTGPVKAPAAPAL